MKLKVTCDCGAREFFDSLHYDVDSFENAIAEWKREHVRGHEKLGDHDDHAFNVDLVPRLEGLRRR